MSAFRLLLLPFSWLYALALRVRHLLYDRGTLTAKTSEVPAIVIGNIALGGTGKTPHVELVLRTLLNRPLDGPQGPVATLSRGYGRSGTAFTEVDRMDDPRAVGDEPLMLKRKFSGIRVFVGADRVAAMAAIGKRVPDVRAVVLDDALQHRALKAGLNIVLTTWQRPWHKDHLLPAGNLRDIPYRAKQAEAVIVTKCPELPTAEEQHQWRSRLGLRDEQALFFSGLEYELPRSLIDSTMTVPSGPGTAALLFTGIADPAPLETHVRTLFRTVQHVAFGDHHAFTASDQAKLAHLFSSFATGEKTLITTEKDAARLGTALIAGPLEDLPIAVIGIRAVILNEPHAFEALIRTHVATHPTNR
ncbi:MAG: tetraacyldisaccharide 4'-kinase [Flavobacteriales bacterium]|jgi:tetraacyldisaccharide 4'-kinase|nr:tetraacyldisaccharide 4'-kinase [Flavobacteriales bacterium]MCB0757355.1 tetraacyldisaccharide 4'-kinase [Flavobacteriales bacterium]